MANAYLYEKKKSPHWYIQFVDSQGIRHDKSTGLRRDDPNDYRKAKVLRAKLETEALKGEQVLAGSWDWVESWLDRHCKTAKTHERYLDAWKWLALWLEIEDLHSPRQITYKKAITYLDWRMNHKKPSGKRAGRNTAIYELRFLRQVMDEAVRLEEADANPLTSLDVQEEEPKEKPELKEEEIRMIAEAVKAEPEWMQISWEIALRTGCRLGETRLHVDNIKLEQSKITFGQPKGGRKKAFSIPIPSKLRPLLERLKQSKEGWIFDFPFQPSRKWGQFLARIGLSHLCFHCLRVTFVSRLHRAGVPREVVMRLVNHVSELVHRIYEREKTEDLVPWTGNVEDAIESAFQEPQRERSRTGGGSGRNRATDGSGGFPRAAHVEPVCQVRNGA